MTEALLYLQTDKYLYIYRDLRPAKKHASYTYYTVRWSMICCLAHDGADTTPTWPFRPAV